MKSIVLRSRYQYEGSLATRSQIFETIEDARKELHREFRDFFNRYCQGAYVLDFNRVDYNPWAHWAITYYEDEDKAVISFSGSERDGFEWEIIEK